MSRAECHPSPIKQQDSGLETEELALPRRFVRVAKREENWGLRRRFTGYSAVRADLLSVRGAAPKCIIRSANDPNDWYIAKSAERWGRVETLTELLNNQIGERLGFRMAHSGILRADGELRFVSRNFQEPNESLIHGSVLFQQVFGDDLNGVGKNNWDEQRTYDIQLIYDLFKEVCGDQVESLFGDLVRMLTFDALIGSMDRHMQNWGLLATVNEPRQYRFAPIFDSARALLWNQDEASLDTLARDESALTGYINRSRPKIGCAVLGKAVNHFGLVQHLLEAYPSPTSIALSQVSPDRVGKATEVLRRFPFCNAFSRERVFLITRVLTLRADMLSRVR